MTTAGAAGQESPEPSEPPIAAAGQEETAGEPTAESPELAEPVIVDPQARRLQIEERRLEARRLLASRSKRFAIEQRYLPAINAELRRILGRRAAPG